ncbi:MAG: DUF4956 domain-containing protein [Clostridia bacterium]|nr:DUF4956 domain-containing protein [Clostridia bacterium]
MLLNIIGTTMTAQGVLICTAVSLVLGLVLSLTYRFTNRECSNHFLVALFLLPALVQCVIMMVNGNLGAGVAVAGAFSLVRFRSAQGSAQEICIIFLAMAVGLTTGMGYVFFAAAFTVILAVVFVVASRLLFKPGHGDRRLKIVVPEDVDYTVAFEELFNHYTTRCALERTKTTNMGSLFELTYRIRMKDSVSEKEFLDALRCRNGNLMVSLSAITVEKESL